MSEKYIIVQRDSRHPRSLKIWRTGHGFTPIKNVLGQMIGRAADRKFTTYNTRSGAERAVARLIAQRGEGQVITIAVEKIN